MDLVVPDPSKTLGEGAIEPWTKPKYKPLAAEMKRYARQAQIPLDIPWSDLDPEHRRAIIEGDGKWVGVRGFFAHLERKKYKLHVRVFLSRYRGYSVCGACGGARVAGGGAAGEDRGQRNLPGLRHDGGTGGAVFLGSHAVGHGERNRR